MTTPATVQASEAADRLREVIRPGDTVYVDARGLTRSREGRKLRFFVSDPDEGPAQMRRVTRDVSGVLGLRYNAREDLAVVPTERSPLGLVNTELRHALFGYTGHLLGAWL